MRSNSRINIKIKGREREMNKCCLNCYWSHARDDADLEYCIQPESPNYGEFIYDIKENNPCKYWRHIFLEFNWPTSKGGKE